MPGKHLTFFRRGTGVFYTVFTCTNHNKGKCRIADGVPALLCIYCTTGILFILSVMCHRPFQIAEMSHWQLSWSFGQVLNHLENQASGKYWFCLLRLICAYFGLMTQKLLSLTMVGLSQVFLWIWLDKAFALAYSGLSRATSKYLSGYLSEFNNDLRHKSKQYKFPISQINPFIQASYMFNKQIQSICPSILNIE